MAREPILNTGAFTQIGHSDYGLGYQIATQMPTTGK